MLDNKIKVGVSRLQKSVYGRCLTIYRKRCYTNYGIEAALFHREVLGLTSPITGVLRFIFLVARQCASLNTADTPICSPAVFYGSPDYQHPWVSERRTAGVVCLMDLPVCCRWFDIH